MEQEVFAWIICTIKRLGFDYIEKMLLPVAGISFNRRGQILEKAASKVKVIAGSKVNVIAAFKVKVMTASKIKVLATLVL